MAVEGRITGWVELLDASEIMEAKRVNDLLNNLGAGDENWEAEPAKWNKSFNLPFEYEVTYWEEPMPDMASKLEGVAELLAEGEYLIFEEKTRHVFNTENSYRMILVVKDHVQFLLGATFLDKFKEALEQAALARNKPRDELDT